VHQDVPFQISKKGHDTSKKRKKGALQKGARRSKRENAPKKMLKGHTGRATITAQGHKLLHDFRILLN